jgi:hypothetical protein
MVVDHNRPEVTEPPKSKKALIISISLHLVVFLLIIFGLPHFKTEPIISEPVPIELVADIGEMTTTNKKPVDAPKPKEEKPPEPPKKTEEPKKPPEPKKSTPEPPAEEVLKDPPKPDKPVEKVDDKAEKKIEKKPEPKKEKPKKTEQNDFDSLLKNLTPTEKQQPDTDEVAKKMTEPTPAPNVSKFADNLSMSEMDALRQQLSQCWNVMAGGVNAEDQVVELSVTVNEAMTVEKAEVVDQSKYNSNAFFRAAADSAKRALRNPLCTPLKLPPNKYSQWHQMTLVFDPKEMF